MVFLSPPSIVTLASSQPRRPLSRSLYRIKQGVAGLLAMFQKVDDTPASTFLASDAFALYARMSKADRAHCLRVYASLRSQGYADSDLLAAALLHDSGKAATRLAVWHRTLKVVLQRWAPERWQMLSKPAEVGTWRYPFYILRTHPSQGAEWAKAAGCSETTVWLIRFHEEPSAASDPRYLLMQALQNADSQN